MRFQEKKKRRVECILSRRLELKYELQVGQADDGLWAVIGCSESGKPEYIHWFDREPDDAEVVTCAQREYIPDLYTSSYNGPWLPATRVWDIPVAEPFKGFLFDTGVPEEMSGDTVEGIAVLGLQAPENGTVCCSNYAHMKLDVLCGCYSCRKTFTARIQSWRGRVTCPSCEHVEVSPYMACLSRGGKGLDIFPKSFARTKDVSASAFVSVDDERGALKVSRYRTEIHYEKGYLVRTIKETHAIVNEIGGEKRAVIRRARQDVECPATDVVRITEKSDDMQRYVGANSFEEFLVAHGEYFKKSGYIDFMAGYAGASDPEAASH